MLSNSFLYQYQDANCQCHWHVRDFFVLLPSTIASSLNYQFLHYIFTLVANLPGSVQTHKQKHKRSFSLSLSLSQLSISYMYGVLMFIAMNTKARQCIPAFLCVFNASNIYFNIILLAKHTSAKPISSTLTFFYYILYSCPIYPAVRFFLNNTT